ncbi:MAG TPA: hypothetical protein VJ984_04575, partial [Xanthomonadales bacterium]|nr:hypothetical protein [Xanthomonadales bacterium]
MIRYLTTALVAVLFSPLALATEAADLFMENLRQICGQAFAGELVDYNDSDVDLLGEEMVMHV